MTNTRKIVSAAVALAIASGLGTITSAARAQWTVTVLDPGQHAFGVFEGQQVGNSPVGPFAHASLWSGTAASWVDLHPAGAQISYLRGIHGNQQVGYAGFFGQNTHACLWSGTPGSCVDLNPGATFNRSEAHGISADQQVGYVFIASQDRASLWTGTVASWVDLSPPGTIYSKAFGVSGGQQVGHAILQGGGPTLHASLWSGSAASWIDLHPPGASEGSQAVGVHGGQQVGTVDGHASLWSGSAASWVDLHPVGALGSNAYGVFNGKQVGYANMSGQHHAGLWSGTAASWEDLHTFLPLGFTRSEARSIWSDASVTHVAGHGISTVLGREAALLWTRQNVTCDPDFTCDGNADQDDVACLIDEIAGNPGCGCQDPDFTRDGNVDQDDVAALINVIAGGSCP